MDNTTKLLRLMDLEKALKPVQYDGLGLENLEALRYEVTMKKEQVIQEGKRK